MHFTLPRLSIPKTAPAERRREPREICCVPVEIAGFDTRGRFFSEQTATLDISASGCRLRVGAKLEKDTSISLRVNPQCNNSIPAGTATLFRVAWTKCDHHGWVAGGEMLLPIPLWQGYFSAATDKSQDGSQPEESGKSHVRT